MPFNTKRLLLLALIALVIFGAFAAAQDDEDEVIGSGQDVRIQDVEEGIDAEDAAGEISDNSDEDKDAATNGLRASHLFLNYADLKVPAGERVEILVPITNALNNPTYEIALIAGNIAALDHSRGIQNFSAQVYQRNVEAGETVTAKYSVTPDALVDPNEYAFVVVAYLRNPEDNTTVRVTAYNGTITVADPLGFDFKGTASVIFFFGVIGGAIYYYITTRKPARSAAPRARAAAVETGTKDAAYDPEFVNKSHLAYVNSQRNRSASK